jgi:hypothetical protein
MAILLNPFIKYPSGGGGGPTDTGWLLPTTSATRIDGDASWSGLSNLYAIDGQFATCSTSAYDITDRLVTHGYAITVPDTATILGVEIRWAAKESSSGTDMQISELMIVKGPYGDEAGTMKLPFDNLTNTLSLYTYGSDSDMWGLNTATLTASDVNHALFGMQIGFDDSGGGGDTTYVDYSQIKIHYTT